MLKSRIPEIVVELQVIAERTEERGSKLVERDAKARVAVDAGKLRDAIHTDEQGDEGTYVVGGDDDAWYGHLVEHGTARTSPRPFLVPALEENRDGIIHMVSVELRAL